MASVICQLVGEDEGKIVPKILDFVKVGKGDFEYEGLPVIQLITIYGKQCNSFNSLQFLSFYFLFFIFLFFLLSMINLK